MLDTGAMPVVRGEMRATTAPANAPTVLCYGHFDVQPPEPLELWTSPPFEPTIRDGWLYARGAADDKGQLWALLHAAAALRDDGALPVNVRFLCDGEEEIGGSSVVELLEAERVRPDACVIFDTPMVDERTPAFTVATRGTVCMQVEVQTGARDLHSGIYGGAALNALHVLVSVLDRVRPRDGRLPEALLAGAEPPAKAERSSWAALPNGAELLAAQCAAPADPDAAADFYDRTWALPSLDITGIEGGSPRQQKTIVVSAARAMVSMRLAPGQTLAQVAPALKHELERDAPPGASVTVEPLSQCDPGRVDPDSPVIRLAADAFERTLGTRPLLLRSGGALPIMPLLERLQIPAVITGFDVPDGNIHAPNERLMLKNLSAAVASAKATFVALADLQTP